MEFLDFTPIIAAILTFMLALLLILNRQFNRLNVAFILLLANESLSSLSGYFTNTADPVQFNIFIHISYVLNGLSFFTILYFVIVLSGYRNKLHKRVIGIRVKDFFLTAIIWLIVTEIFLNFTNVLVKDITYSESTGFVIQWSYWMFIPQAFSIISIVFIFSMMINALRRAKPGSRRSFLKLNIIGTMILFGAGPIIGILLPTLGIKTDLLVEYGTLISSLIYFYAMTKYQYDTINDLNVSLERKVEERTRHLRETQARLVQSEKMAALSKLVAGIAHELNTPIGAMNSAHDTLKRAATKIEKVLVDNENKQISSSIDAIKSTSDVVIDGSKRVSNIVNRMKSFSQLDEADLQTVDIHAGIQNTIAVFTPELHDFITIHEEFSDLDPLTCYPARLNQLILFLLDNANHAIVKDGEIRISTTKKNNHVEICLKDTGIGIPEENMEKIFDPGFTTWGVGIGVGLGLSIAYQIVKEHHGELKVESSPGNGTSVTIKIPIDLHQKLADKKEKP